MEPIRWLPEVKGRSFRLQDGLFESNSTVPCKDKLRTAVPHGATVLIYRTPEDFNAVVRTHRDLRWIKGELKSQYRRSNRRDLVRSADKQTVRSARAHRD